MNKEQALAHDIFKIVHQVATELEIETYVIGGYVRDFLLQRDYQKDIDFVAVGDGILLAKKVAERIPEKPQVSVFKNFGTAMFRIDSLEIEFVGARKESYQWNSRKPMVKSGSLEDDQNRRDFTINALAISLNKDNFGQLIDPFNGVNDLEQKIIRTPLDPDITYSDDPLRMLRAIRFASQLDFTIEKQSLQAISAQAERIKIISPERISEELHKIIMTNQPSVGFSLLHKTDLLPYILPELSNLQGIEEIEGQRHKDNFWHTLEVVDNISQHTSNLWLRWAALLHDIGKAPTKRYDQKHGWTFHGHEYVGSKMVYKLFKRLRLPLNDKLKYVQKLVAMSSRPIAITGDVTDSAVRRLVFDAGEDLEDLMTLCRADITTKNHKRYTKYHQNFEKVSQKIVEVEERDHIRNFQPPISGKEIMETFDLKPCREVGLIKDAIKEAILEGEIPNQYEAAKTYMFEKAKSLGLTPTV